MKEKGIFAVPTFTIFDYFAHHRESQDQAAAEAEMLDYKIREFKKQIARESLLLSDPMSDHSPMAPQAREMTLMVQFGMKPLAALQADLINGAKLLGWGGQIGELKPGYFADIIAVPGNPLDDISTCEHVSFVMKNGEVLRPLGLLSGDRGAYAWRCVVCRSFSRRELIFLTASTKRRGLTSAIDSSTALRYPPR